MTGRTAANSAEPGTRGRTCATLTTVTTTADREVVPPSPAAPGRRPQVLDAVGLLARLALGGVLLVAGLLKITDPQAQERAVRAYQLLPEDVVEPVAFALAPVEVVLGLLLLSGLGTRMAAVVGGLLMVAFVIGVASAWARGLSIDCGCFGDGGHEVGVTGSTYALEITRDMALAAAAALLVVRPRSWLSADGALGLHGRPGPPEPQEETA